MADDDWRRPDEALAARIADRLARAGLIAPADLPEARERVASGRAGRGDWIAWIERAMDDADQDGSGDGPDR